MTCIQGREMGRYKHKAYEESWWKSPYIFIISKHWTEQNENNSYPCVCMCMHAKPKYMHVQGCVSVNVEGVWRTNYVNKGKRTKQTMVLQTGRTVPDCRGRKMAGSTRLQPEGVCPALEESHSLISQGTPLQNYRNS